MNQHSFSDFQTIPANKKNLIQTTFGSSGQMWLTTLESLREEAINLWDLRLISELPSDLFFIYRVESRHFGPAVLKICLPDRSFERQVQSLLAFSTSGAVKVLDYRTDPGLLLMEELIPGTTLQKRFEEKKAQAVFCRILQKLKGHTPKASDYHLYPDFIDIAATCFRHHLDHETLDADLIKYGLKILHSLASQSHFVRQLCHGDLHQQNILVHGQEWKFIDPKGIIAPFEFEMGAYMRNSLPENLDADSIQTLLKDRVDYFSQSLSRSRIHILMAGFTSTLLATLYSFEDKSPIQKQFLMTTEVFFTLLDVLPPLNQRL